MNELLGEVNELFSLREGMASLTSRIRRIQDFAKGFWARPLGVANLLFEGGFGIMTDVVGETDFACMRCRLKQRGFKT